MGWRNAEQRAVYYAFQLGAPLLAALVMALIDALLFNADAPFLTIFAAAAVAFLLPKRWLKKQVAKRRAMIANEVSTIVTRSTTSTATRLAISGSSWR